MNLSVKANSYGQTEPNYKHTNSVSNCISGIVNSTIFAILPYIMKETHRETIWETIRTGNFEQVYVNPGLDTIVSALEQTMNRKSVIVLYTEDIPRTSLWQTISSLPETASSMLPTRRAKANLERWSNMFPHLIRPVKTIYGFYNLGSGYLKMTDALLGHTGTEITRAAMLTEIPHLGKYFLKNTSGWLFNETLVNLPRIKTGLLREIFARGGVVLNYVNIQKDDKGVYLKDKLNSESLFLPLKNLSKESEIPNRTLFQFPLSPWFQFSMRLNYESHRLNFFEQGNHLLIETSPLGTVQEMRKMISIFLGNDAKTVSPIQIPGDETPQLAKRFPKIFTQIRPESHLGGATHPPVEDFIETAYDLAKQTGIGFADFRSIYLKYGGCTNWLTDRTYEWMPVIRNSQRLWRQAEQEFCSRFEWGINQTSMDTEN